MFQWKPTDRTFGLIQRNMIDADRKASRPVMKTFNRNHRALPTLTHVTTVEHRFLSGSHFLDSFFVA